MTTRFMVVPASYVLLLRDGPAPTDPPQVLLQLRQNTGYRDGHWAAAAAGHVEARESCVDAALRELAEELGVEADADDVRPLVTLHRTSGTGDVLDERVDWFFTCRHWRGEPRRIEPHKNAELAWFGLDALPAPIPPHERYVLDGLRRGDLPPVVCFGFPDAPGYPPEDGRTPPSAGAGVRDHGETGRS